MIQHPTFDTCRRLVASGVRVPASFNWTANGTTEPANGWQRDNDIPAPALCELLAVLPYKIPRGRYKPLYLVLSKEEHLFCCYYEDSYTSRYYYQEAATPAEAAALLVLALVEAGVGLVKTERNNDQP